MLNHNLETVARLQRAVRPSAGYARSLAVLARAKDAGLVTKSGMILGMGERRDEVVGALADLRAVGVDIVTLGQYLRPTAAHLPVARWWTPEEFESLRAVGEEMGFAHVEASPLTRSSYHARGAAAAAAGTTGVRSVTDRQAADAERSGSSGCGPAWTSSGWTRCSCPTAPTCPGSRGTGPCRSSGSRCWCCPARARPCSSSPPSRPPGCPTRAG